MAALVIGITISGVAVDDRTSQGVDRGDCCSLRACLSEVIIRLRPTSQGYEGVAMTKWSTSFWAAAIAALAGLALALVLRH